MKPILLLALALLALAGCDKLNQPETLATAMPSPDNPTVASTTGTPERGRGLFAVYGCTGCHTIPGVSGADGLIGPPLQKMPHRGYVAGVLNNTPANLVRWIQDPRGVDPQPAMPNLNVTRQDAADMAAYLYTLR